MFLSKLILVNWGNIPQREFDFGPINLFSGGNGSGKTTAADAIQTIMTAAHDNLFNFNPGQDETTQRGRGGKQVRTLASYILGCDDGSYARPWATDGYLAAVFRPHAGEKSEAFTAVIAMRAHLDSSGSTPQARLDDLKFLILPCETLSLKHFVREFKDGEHLVPVNDIVKLLRHEFSDSSVELYEKKNGYLKRLYGALRGKPDAISDREAKHAAKTFASFMAYKPVKSITEFVSQEILERKNMGEAIRTVSDLVKTIHTMEEDARFIVQSINTLSQANNAAQEYVQKWIGLLELQYCEAKRQALVNQQAYLQSRSQQKKISDQITEIEKRIAVLEQRRHQAWDEIVQLQAQRQGIKSLQDKDQLERSIATFNKELVDQAKPLLSQNHQIDQSILGADSLLKQLNQSSLGVQIGDLDKNSFRKAVQELAHYKSQNAIDVQQLLAKDWVDISPLESYLDQAMQIEQKNNQLAELLHGRDIKEYSLRDLVAQHVTRQENQQQGLQRQLSTLEKEIHVLHSQRVSYPPYVETALRAIAQQCPKAEPRVLCDYIEINDSDWQMAIEGYLGGARFSIIVEPEYEAETISIVRSIKESRNRARVIQGSKAQQTTEKLNLVNHSIVNLMEFSHKTAEYYLHASYGNVVTVANAEELRVTPRGITQEGLASGNYSMWRCDLPDSELVFGQGARVRAAAAKQMELNQKAEEANHLHLVVQQSKQLLNTLDQIQSTQFVEQIEKILATHRQLKKSETALANLDLNEFSSLENELQELTEHYQNIEAENKSLLDQLGGAKVQLEQSQKKAQKLADIQEHFELQTEEQEKRVFAVQKFYPTLSADAFIETADKQAANAKDNSFLAEIEKLRASLTTQIQKVIQAVMTHNQHCHQYDTITFAPDFSTESEPEFLNKVVGLTREVDNLHNRLKNNVLVEKHQQLTQLKESFNSAFVTHLCHSIYQSINEGKRVLEDINLELEHHQFGADKETFSFGYQWVPEFKEYWQFFKEIIGSTTLGDGHTLFDMELSKASQKVRDKLLSMLLDEDEQKALRELDRVSDYRNYRSYEIYKQPLGKAKIPLSQYGTGSGGQLETPAYIIRSAAVTSAFKFNEGNSHLKMVLVDEAFSKMDETRSREVIHYLTETLGLQLLFIMPTSKSGPFMDVISNQFVFSKVPTSEPIGELNTRVLVDRKVCRQDKIKALWQEHRETIRQQGLLDFMKEFESA